MLGSNMNGYYCVLFLFGFMEPLKLSYLAILMARTMLRSNMNDYLECTHTNKLVFRWAGIKKRHFFALLPWENRFIFRWRKEQTYASSIGDEWMEWETLQLNSFLILKWTIYFFFREQDKIYCGKKIHTQATQEDYPLAKEQWRNQPSTTERIPCALHWTPAMESEERVVTPWFSEKFKTCRDNAFHLNSNRKFLNNFIGCISWHAYFISEC
jgi:hypothetical protein